MVHEELEIKGHVLDSLTLSKVLDNILESGGGYEIREFRIGKTRTEPSYARLWVSVKNRDALRRLLRRLAFLGARQIPAGEAAVKPARRSGVAPEGFAVTTNLPTEVYLRGRWVPVAAEEMDCAMVASRNLRSVRPVPISELQKGDLVVCGRTGIRMPPIRREAGTPQPMEAFAFMSSQISGERPAHHAVAALAEEMRRVKRRRKRILFVVGPAVVHTGGAPILAALIREGWVQVLFAGNALAVHDIEYAFFGTSLGLRVRDGGRVPHGHENHLRAINTIRRVGSIDQAVKKKILTDGIMHDLVSKKVPFVLAGSIRDDGPLPEVITDTAAAQAAMRKHLGEVEIAVMVATTLHAIATGNLLSARVRTVCVDLDPACVTKLIDRGSAQAAGLVMDGTSFLRGLAEDLDVSLGGA